MEIQNYELPDQVLLDDTSHYRYLIWQPKTTCIVLGRSNNDVDQAILVETAKNDGIPVIQRSTGGQTVVLSPSMLVISILLNEINQLPSHQYFKIYNERIIAALGKLGIENLDCKGISDIVIGNKKIAGTAIYRNRQKIFYHAVLNCGQDPSIFERYLRFPDRVPDYREGRSHIEFVSSLVLEGYDIPLDEIEKAIAKELVSPPT